VPGALAFVSGADGRPPSPRADAAASLNGHEQAKSVPTRRLGNDVRLASGALREMVARIRSGHASPADIGALKTGVRVEILHGLSSDRLASLLARDGVKNLRPIDDGTVEAVVPVEQLEALEASPGVQFVRPPLVVNGPPDRPRRFHFSALDSAFQAGSLTGQHVIKTNASNWHAFGRVGNGVKVGIIDGFSPSHWNQALASGDVPTPAGTFCVENGAACDIWTKPSTHGVGVAEIIHDMAPGAQLYIAYASPTAADLQATVNYFASQGVRVISRSQTAWYDGPGNGTGPIASVIENAVSRGMVWLNSAGNSGGTPDDPGAYWRGTWADPDGDTWLNFGTNDESLGFYCGFPLGVRWSDWALLRTDYDIYVYDDPGLTVLDAKGENDQPGGAPPIEYFMDPNNPTVRANTCDSQNDVDFLAIKLYNANGGTAGDALEFMVNNSLEFEYWQNPYSATQPASDTASAGGLSVGAIDPWDGTTVAKYSSQGPSNDGRVKPDLSAATCVSTTVDNCFNGTSGATPVVAGAAALYIGVNPAASPAQVKNFLVSAVVDRGAAGPDNVYGVGELVLPTIAGAPPPPAPPPAPPAPPPAPSVRTVIMSMSGPRASFQRERTFQVSWRAVANAARYDVQYRAAQFRGIYGAWKAWKTGTPETSTSFIGQTGTSYCFRVKANPQSGYDSNWTNARCTTLPVSVLNRTMRGRGGWRYYRARGRYLNRFALSVRRGASLGLTGVRATRLALIATKCPRCGSVSVYWNKRRIATARLTSSSLLYKQVIEVGSFPTQQKGSIRIVVTSRGKPVAIEGLGVFS
jgi:Subtilase family